MRILLTTFCLVIFSGILIADTEWTGDVNTNWTEPGNWTDGVPTINVDAEIPGDTDNQPIIMNGTDAVARTVEIKGDGRLIIENGATLIVDEYMEIQEEGRFDLNEGGTLTVNGYEDYDCINMDGEDVLVRIDGTANLKDADAAAIAVDGGRLIVGGTGRVNVSELAYRGIEVEEDGEVTIEEGGLVNISKSRVNDAIYMDAGAKFMVRGSLYVSDIRGDGIDIDDEDCLFTVASTGEVTIRDGDNEDENGIEISGNMIIEEGGQVIVDGEFQSFPNIIVGDPFGGPSEGFISISGTFGSGVVIDEEEASLTVNGTLEIRRVLDDGINLSYGTLTISETGVVNIMQIGDFEIDEDDNGIELNGEDENDSKNFGIININEINSGSGIVIDGQPFTNEESGEINISGCTDDGIKINDGEEVMFTNYGKVDIEFTFDDGIDCTDDRAFENEETGVITISKTGPSLLGPSGGGLLNFPGPDPKDDKSPLPQIGSGGSSHGIEDMTGVNKGIIQVQDVSGDGINGGDLIIRNTGFISITNPGRDGLDLDEVLENEGTICINSSGDELIADDVLQLLEGGIVKLNDGFVDAENLEFAPGSTLAPGASPGSFIVNGDLDLTGATYQVEVEGTTPGVTYDQTIVNNGTVILWNTSLELIFSAPVAGGETFVIIDNDDMDAVLGTFNGLPEGATFSPPNSATIELTISYIGGDGNDVVLTVSAVSIPTMGQWAFFLFGLTVLTLMVVSLYNVKQVGLV